MSYSGLCEDQSQGQSYRFDLETAVQYGLANNKGIHAAQSALRGAETNVKSACGVFLPQVITQASYRKLENQSAKEFNQDYLDQNGYTTSVRLSQPLFTGFYGINFFQRSRIEREISENRLNMAKLDLIYEIQQYFLALLKAREDYRSAETAIQRFQLHLKSAESYVQEGMKPYLWVLQVRSELANTEEAAIKAKNAEKTISIYLNSLLNIPMDAHATYEGQQNDEINHLSFTMEECKSKALENRPDIDVARKNIDVTEKNVSIIQSRFYPKLSLDMDYYNQDTNYNTQRYIDMKRDYWSVGLNMQWVLFSGGQDYFAKQTAYHEVNRYQELLQELKNKSAVDVSQAYFLFEDAKERIGSAKKALEAAQESYNLATTRFETNIGTSTEILDAQTLIIKNEAGLNQALTDHRLAIARLYHAMGIINYNLK